MSPLVSLVRNAVLTRVQQLQEEFQNAGTATSAGLTRRPAKVAIAGAEYEREITRLPIKQKKGSAIFYSNDYSDTPYLIFIYDAYKIAEYRLVSFKDTNLPSQIFLRLTQAVLAAHDDGRILGSDLNLGNISWDVSQGSNGLPCVTFDNLPPPLPPKSVPGFESNLCGSMKEDVRNATIVLLQLVEHVENIVPVSKETLEMSKFQGGTHEIEYSSFAPQNEVPFPSHIPEIPEVIKENKLLRIVDKCLSPERAQRPTAAALCKMLLRLCRSFIVSGAVLDIGKSILSTLKRVMP